MGGLLHQLVRQVRTDNLPTIFKNAKGGDADAIYQIATHLKYSSSTRDKSSELFALCAEMGSGGCNFEYGKLVADGRVKVINGVNGDAYIIRAISIYEEEYNKNPTAMLALKIADFYNYLSTQDSFETRKQALRYYQLGAEGKIPRAVAIYRDRYNHWKDGGIKQDSSPSEDNQIISELILPADIEDFEQYFSFSDIDIPDRIQPTHVTHRSPEELKEEDSQLQNRLFYLPIIWVVKTLWRQLTRLSEINRICQQFGDKIRFISYITYHKDKYSKEKVPRELLYEEISTIAGLIGEHYITVSASPAELITLDRNVDMFSDRILVFDKNKRKSAIYLDSETTVDQLERTIASKIK